MGAYSTYNVTNSALKYGFQALLARDWTNRGKY